MMLGSTDTAGVTSTSVATTAGAVDKVAGESVAVPSPSLMDGLKIWTTPSMIIGAFTNLPTMVSAAPMAALGFLLPVVGVAFVVMQSQLAGGAGRRR